MNYSIADLELAIKREQIRNSYHYRKAVENSELSLAEKILADELESEPSVDWNEFGWEFRSNTFLDGIGHVSVEHDHGGGEGDGEERWVVVKVENDEGTRLFRIDGYYMSYDGSHFDGELYEVEVVERLVKFYEPKGR